VIVWLTGQPGSGKTTIAREIARLHRHRDPSCNLIDGDQLRLLLDNPGYDRAGRERNIDRAQAIAAWADEYLYADVLVALVAPYREQREAFKARHNVLEVYLWTDEIRGREQYFVEDYEPPQENFIGIDTGACTVEQAVRTVRRAMAALSRRPRLADSTETR
jgi:adenylylsulfate kinase